MEKREIDLTVSCYGKVKDVKYDVVILPWGATEPHNLHLPYLTDCILPHDIAVDAATLALERSGVRCMVMPPVPFGAHNPGQRELPFLYSHPLYHPTGHSGGHCSFSLCSGHTQTGDPRRTWREQLQRDDSRSCRYLSRLPDYGNRLVQHHSHQRLF